MALDPDASSAAVLSAADAALSGGDVPPFGMMVIDDAAPGRLAAVMLAGYPLYER